jgi:hypothetical protein
MVDATAGGHPAAVSRTGTARRVAFAASGGLLGAAGQLGLQRTAAAGDEHAQFGHWVGMAVIAVLSLVDHAAPVAARDLEEAR